MLEIPDGWRQTTIGEVLTLQRGFDITRSEQRNGPIPVISSGGIGSYHDKAMVKGPGVVLGRKGTLGKIFYVEKDYWPHDTTLWVKDFKGNSPRFIYYFFRTLDLIQMDVGSANPTLNRNHVHPLSVMWPPRDVQDSISLLLGSLDHKIELNERICDTSLALGDAYLLKATDEPLLRRPRLDELVSSGQLSFGDGYRTKQSEYGRPGVPILRVAEVLDGRIEPSKFPDFVCNSYRSAMGSRISRPGDVILTTKGSVGRVAIVGPKDPSFVYSPQVCYFRFPVDSQLSNSYFYFWLRGSDFWRQAATMKSQTDMADYLSLTDIRKLAIPVPKVGTVRPFHSLLAQVSAFHAQNKILSELRDTLLPRLISGELRIRDAEGIVEDAI